MGIEKRKNDVISLSAVRQAYPVSLKRRKDRAMPIGAKDFRLFSNAQSLDFGPNIYQHSRSGSDVIRAPVPVDPSETALEELSPELLVNLSVCCCTKSPAKSGIFSEGETNLHLFFYSPGGTLLFVCDAPTYSF